MPQKDPSRTEKATPKRRKKAREEGNVPRSQELSKVMSLLAGVIALRIGISFIGKEIIELYNWFLDKGIYTEVNQDNIYALFLFCAQKIALIVLPIMIFIALISFITVRLQVGHLWTSKPLKPKFKNFNLVAGLKKIFFDPKTFIRLARSLLQAAAVAIAPYLVLKSEFHNLLPLFYESTTGIAIYILDTGYTMTKYALVPMLIIGIADIIYTRWDYEENLKMTKDEIKDERKQAEGDPTIKSKQKQYLIKETLPKAWNKLITEPDELLVELLAETTEKLCGYKPDSETVEQFLTSFTKEPEKSKRPTQPTFRLPSELPTHPVKPVITQNYTGKSIVSFVFKGNKYEVKTWNIGVVR
jgi:flagellar biosynthetic protein FlhB